MSIVLNLSVVHNFVADLLVDDIFVVFEVIFKYLLLDLFLHNIIGGKKIVVDIELYVSWGVLKMLLRFL